MLSYLSASSLVAHLQPPTINLIDSPAVAGRCYPWLAPDEYAISFCRAAKPRSCPACPSPVTGMISDVGYNVVFVTGSARSEG
jgi:hypothetical protein